MMALFQTTYMKLHKNIPNFKSRMVSCVLLAVCGPAFFGTQNCILLQFTWRKRLNNSWIEYR